MMSVAKAIATALLGASSVVTLAQVQTKPSPGEDSGWAKPVL